MAVFIPPFDPNKPVPNNPFYLPRQPYLSSPLSGIVTVGGGLEFDYGTATLSGGEVYIQTGDGIAGGPITGTGTLTLAHSGVIAGTYALNEITVDIYGRVVDAAPSAVFASEERSGAIQIASPLAVAQGTNNSLALTPANLQSIKSSSVADTSQTKIATPYAVKQAYDLAALGISSGEFTAKGQLLTATGSSAYIALDVGTDGQVLKACAACPSGLFWTTDEAGDDIPRSIFTAPGQILAATGGSTFVAVAPGANGQTLTACSACTGGVTWATIAGVPTAAPLAEGVLFGCSTNGNFTASVGYCALNSLTIGQYNTALGHSAAKSTDSGSCNTALGALALSSNVGGSCNVGVGYAAIPTDTNSYGNTAVGALAMFNGTGDSNTLIGLGSGCTLSTGCLNTFAGAFSGSGITTGSCNIVLGYTPALPAALQCNIVFGINGTNIRLQINESGALSFNGASYGTTGQVLQSNGTGSAPTWVALPAGSSPATPVSRGIVLGCTENAGNFNVSLGYQTLFNVASSAENVAIGVSAGSSLTTGGENTAVGGLALTANATGNGNIAVGHAAMGAAPGGFANVAVGLEALNFTSGDRNLAIGEGALRSTTNQNDNVAVGACSLYNNVAFNNTSVGTCSLTANTFGDCQAVFGYQAARCNTTGSELTALGYQAMFSNFSGSGNTAVGMCALYSSVSGNQNVAVGVRALQTAIGACNTSVGMDAGGFLVSGNNNLFLGWQSGTDALCNLTTGSNHVVIGNNFTTTIVQKVASTIGSDIRSKKVVGEVPLALPFVESIETIKYQWCDRNTGEVTDDRYRYGFSAQNVIENEENPEHPIIGNMSNPDMFTLSPTDMIPVLVNAIKELSAEVKSLKRQIGG